MKLILRMIKPITFYKAFVKDNNVRVATQGCLICKTKKSNLSTLLRSTTLIDMDVSVWNNEIAMMNTEKRNKICKLINQTACKKILYK